MIVIIISVSKQTTAQITTPSETRKQAKSELKTEQKRERARKNEAEKAKAETEKNNAGILDEKISKKRKGKRSKESKRKLE